MTIKLREYIVTLVLFSLSTSSKPEPEPEHCTVRSTIVQYVLRTRLVLQLTAVNCNLKLQLQFNCSLERQLQFNCS
jgi:hypothetical protein